jgi:hypothetical protein
VAVRAKRLERRRVVPIRTLAAASVACRDAHRRVQAAWREALRRVRAERKRSIPIAATTERGPPGASVALRPVPWREAHRRVRASANGRPHSRPRRSVTLHSLLTPHFSLTALSLAPARWCQCTVTYLAAQVSVRVVPLLSFLGFYLGTRFPEAPGSLRWQSSLMPCHSVRTRAPDLQTRGKGNHPMCRS